jgi:molybdenum cofactor sulfurtransferase
LKVMALERDDLALAESCAQFRRAYPGYEGTARLDDLRTRDYARLDRTGQVYLDYTGAGLYAESQVTRHAEFLRAHVLGNPHSASPTSDTTTQAVERVRRRVLAYFNAPAELYTVVFTLNATGAIKHVGECFPFAARSRCLLTADNHNSVNGIREFAERRGADVQYVSLTMPDLRIDRAALGACLAQADPHVANLFAYPAQSNFSGVKHPLEFVREAQDQGWRVLLDAAAFVPTNRLDVARVRPDFVSVSFYKMFGYPTGVGCLIARTEALAALRRPWFAGGTVNFASVRGRTHILAPREAGFEDGTLNFLDIAAVEIGLDHIEAVGIDCIATRVHCLTGWLLARLLELRHSNGRHMVRIYGPAAMEARGATITMNFYDPDGHLLDYRRVEELAAGEGLSLRTGCFCNPGAGEVAEGLTAEDMREAAATGTDMSLPRFLQFIQHRGGRSAGAIRASLGIASNFADAYRFYRFAADLRDQTRLTLGDVTFDIESCRVIRDGS